MNRGDMLARPGSRLTTLTNGSEAMDLVVSEPGMTIREAFAMAAMQGVMSNPALVQLVDNGDGTSYFTAPSVGSALDYADTMLAELAKPHA